MRRYAPMQVEKSISAEPPLLRKLKPLGAQSTYHLQALAEMSHRVGVLRQLQAHADEYSCRNGRLAQLQAGKDDGQASNGTPQGVEGTEKDIPNGDLIPLLANYASEEEFDALLVSRQLFEEETPQKN